METALMSDDAALAAMFQEVASDPAAPFRVREAAGVIAEEIPWRTDPRWPRIRWEGFRQA